MTVERRTSPGSCSYLQKSTQRCALWLKSHKLDRLSAEPHAAREQSHTDTAPLFPGRMSCLYPAISYIHNPQFIQLGVPMVHLGPQITEKKCCHDQLTLYKKKEGTRSFRSKQSRADAHRCCCRKTRTVVNGLMLVGLAEAPNVPCQSRGHTVCICPLCLLWTESSGHPLMS